MSNWSPRQLDDVNKYGGGWPQCGYITLAVSPRYPVFSISSTPVPSLMFTLFSVIDRTADVRGVRSDEQSYDIRVLNLFLFSV